MCGRARFFAAVLLLASLAWAQEDINALFRAWDADGDGVLTRDEMPDEAVFGKADKDGDGKLTREEVKAFLHAKPVIPEEPADEAKKPGPAEGKSDAAPMRAPRSLGERVEDFVRRLDRNKDGRVQAEEYQGGEEVFRRYDRNRDRALSLREVRRYVGDLLKAAKRRPRPDNFFDLFDLDRDDRVTRREYDGPPAFFRAYDHDKDNVVTSDEINLGRDGGRMRPRERRGEDDGPTTAPERGLLERYDENRDGRITLEELGGAESVLNRLDRNGDGVLSGSEVR